MANTRPYRSDRRQRQAEQTRGEVLAVARRLFSERGYAATPVTEIADAADVSVPTLYASIGTKASIALALVEFIDAEVDMESLGAAQARAATPVELLRATARLTRVLNEECGDIMRALLSAAAADPEVAPAAAAGRQVHREGCRRVVERIQSMGGLAEGLTPAQATAVLSTCTSPEAIERLTQEHGWGYDEVEAWLADAMPKLLLKPTRQRRAPHVTQ